MRTAELLHELPLLAAERDATSCAIVDGDDHLSYGALSSLIARFAAALSDHGVGRGERVAVWLEKCSENVVACFGIAASAGVFVPINPALKPDQACRLLMDCGARALITSSERLNLIASQLAACNSIQHIVLVHEHSPSPSVTGAMVHGWLDWIRASSKPLPKSVDADLVAILYTSGSTGWPKGVCLSHRNLLAGARSVAGYLENGPDDRLLAALPLSFDAGFSQITTAFLVRASVVLHNYLLPGDALRCMAREQVTGLTGVPPMFIQLAQSNWPEAAASSLRYFANTGGHLPVDTLAALRSRAPRAKPFLMYGLTESFRSTYLPPEEVDRRPDSIGKAIPNAEVLVLRADGTPCEANEAGELVHRGALVSLGYWNAPGATAERFRPLPAASLALQPELPVPELAVFSGDIVRRDDEGFLYFIGRRDEMIKTSGYRVSPTEIEEVVRQSGLVGECVAFGAPHPTLGQAIHLVVTPSLELDAVDHGLLRSHCRQALPGYMVPSQISVLNGPLPRNPNGKYDRKAIADLMNATCNPSVSSAQGSYAESKRPPRA